MIEIKSDAAAGGLGASRGQAIAAVLVAAGEGRRLGSSLPKARVEVAGKPLLAWALEGLLAAGVASRIVVTVPAGDRVLSALAAQSAALAVTGGPSRAASVAAGLKALAAAPVQPGFPDDPPQAVLVHDCARCFTPAAVFDRVVAALADGEEAVIPVLPVVDTIKAVDAKDYVVQTYARDQLRAVQTPQGFDLPRLLAAYAEASQRGLAESITDDAMLAETLGIRVKTVAGSAESFKITTALDLALARALYEKE